MWYSGKPIPTNLITGFLGTGKTTAICELLSRRPEGERWTVFVNEYGMVSIDDHVMSTSSPDVVIQELAGGCFCCTTAGLMETALVHLIRRTKPDRLIIEPSGAGHPAGVIDRLRSERFRSAIDLRATICLVDPKDFENPRVTNTAGFHDQIQMADIVVLNWTDKRTTEQTQRCRDWIESFDPPKLLIAETQFGQLAPDWLNAAGTVWRTPKFPEAHQSQHKPREHSPDGSGTVDIVLRVPPGNSADNQPLQIGSPAAGRPVRLINEGGGQKACGWVFSVEDVFDRESLLDYLGSLPGMLRAKGLFRCTDDWWLFQRTRHDVSITTSAYRRDSRMEIIVDEDSTIEWDDVERSIMNLRSNTATP